MFKHNNICIIGDDKICKNKESIVFDYWNIVNFLKIYASKDFDSVRDRNDFFNNFISRVNLYDDRITIVYNTSLNPTEEIYKKPDNDPNNNDNNGGTTIYKTELNLENMQEKKSFKLWWVQTTIDWRSQCYPILTPKSISVLDGLSWLLDCLSNQNSV